MKQRIIINTDNAKLQKLGLQPFFFRTDLSIKASNSLLRWYSVSVGVTQHTSCRRGRIICSLRRDVAAQLTTITTVRRLYWILSAADALILFVFFSRTLSPNFHVFLPVPSLIPDSNAVPLAEHTLIPSREPPCLPWLLAQSPSNLSHRRQWRCPNSLPSQRPTSILTQTYPRLPRPSRRPYRPPKVPRRPPRRHNETTKKHCQARLATLRLALLGVTGANSSRICSLKRKTCLIVVALLALTVIGAVVGGVVAGTRRKGSSSSSEAETSTSNSSILPNFALVSVNWTNPKGYQYYYVFHQDRNDAIVQSSYDSQNKTWRARSIWDSSSSSSGPGLLKATSLTAVTWHDSNSDWNIRVYVLYSDRSINRLLVQDNDADSQWKALTQEDGPGSTIAVGNGSNLAAARPQTRDDIPVMLVYQDDENRIICGIAIIGRNP